MVRPSVGPNLFSNLHRTAVVHETRFATLTPNGDAITVGRLEETADRWPSFVPEALARGFRSAHAVPLRLRKRTIGALNLFSRREQDLDALGWPPPYHRAASGHLLVTAAPSPPLRTIRP
jgi:hypothetical protein